MLSDLISPSVRANPLDDVEDLMIANDWVYSRQTNEELSLSLSGKLHEYSLSFQWNEIKGLLNISCRINEVISDDKMGEAILIANQLNQSVKMGHFLIDPEQKTLIYRYTLLSGADDTTADPEYLANLVEMLMCDCEENVSIFKCFLHKDLCQNDKQLLALLIVPAEGQA
ncbi:MAG: YbjN domain-containing protein [Rhodospirillales bacterium]|nr:YbjN domain-containing protein [Rhodospirillales bacterium]MCB9973573.1 YbjN domain-containing protein [Rhodospirillales bacterium]MCB9979623.1 YbjN domain-containing protein [Rhodospirillales bacterium]